MHDLPKLLDVVALLEDVPYHSVQRGQVGTVVGELAPGVFEVEFADDDGRTYGQAALRAQQVIVLRYEPTMAVSRPLPPMATCTEANTVAHDHRRAR